MDNTMVFDWLEKSLGFLQSVLDSPEKIAWCRSFDESVPESFQAEVGDFLLGYRECGMEQRCRDALHALEERGGCPAPDKELSLYDDTELEGMLAGLMDGGSPFSLYGMSSGLLAGLLGELLARRQTLLQEGGGFRLSESDLPSIAALSERLRPGSGELISHAFKRQLEDPKAALFGCRRDDELLGLAHARIRRDYVEGARECKNGVAYLEGIYLTDDAPDELSAQLIAAVSEWAKDMGCRELATDCALGDAAAAAIRTGAGFREVAKIICYIQEL